MVVYRIRYLTNSYHVLSLQNTMRHLLPHVTHVPRTLARQSLKRCKCGRMIGRVQKYTGSTGWLEPAKRQSPTHSVISSVKRMPLLVPSSLLISGLILVMFVASFPPSPFSWPSIFPL